MNREQLRGNWDELRGQVRSKWGKLTDEDVDQIRGRREELVGRIRHRYGVAREQAEKQVDTWLEKI